MPEYALDRVEFHDLGRQILGSGSRVRFQAHGQSMQPFIQDGDIIVVAPLAGETLHIGDVLLVETDEGRWLVHRLVRTGKLEGKPVYSTRGDACTSPDGWFQTENLLGRVIILEHGDQHIDITTPPHQRRARLWVIISPWVPSLAWFPVRVRHLIRQWCFGSLIPD